MEVVDMMAEVEVVAEAVVVDHPMYQAEAEPLLPEHIHSKFSSLIPLLALVSCEPPSYLIL